MWHDIGVALSLVLVIEGMLPFLSPAHCRAMAATMAEANDRTLRVLGLASMLLGAVLLSLLK